MGKSQPMIQLAIFRIIKALRSDRLTDCLGILSFSIHLGPVSNAMTAWDLTQISVYVCPVLSLA